MTCGVSDLCLLFDFHSGVQRIDPLNTRLTHTHTHNSYDYIKEHVFDFLRSHWVQSQTSSSDSSDVSIGTYILLGDILTLSGLIE